MEFIICLLIATVIMFISDKDSYGNWYEDKFGWLTYVFVVIFTTFIFIAISLFTPQHHNITEKITKYDKITEINNSFLIESGKDKIILNKKNDNVKIIFGNENKLIQKNYDYDSCEDSFPNNVLFSADMNKVEYVLVVK